jgi:antitoxin FitA
VLAGGGAAQLNQAGLGPGESVHTIRNHEGDIRLLRVKKQYGPQPFPERRGRARAQAQGLSLEQSLRDLLTATARQGHALRDELAQLRATTPSSGRQLNVAALIRDDRDGR